MKSSKAGVSWSASTQEVRLLRLEADDSVAAAAAILEDENGEKEPAKN
jgi:hypothetical protein